MPTNLLFHIKRTIKLGTKSLWMHKLRSILTTLGIVFGVSSVIAMLAIGAGASQQAQQQIARLGSRNIIIKTVKPPEANNVSQQQTDTMNVYGLTYNDAEQFRNTLGYADVVVPVQRTTQQVMYRNRQLTVEIIGTVPWYPEIKPVKMEQGRGRFFSNIDLEFKQRVCVVEDSVAKELFLVDDPIGRDIKIKNNYYHVIGIMHTIDTKQAHQSAASQSGSAIASGGGVVGRIFIPLSSFKDSFGEVSIKLSASSIQREKVELKQITVKVHTLKQVLPTAAVLKDMLGRTHKKKDYQIIVPLDLIKQAAESKRIFSIVLGSIAAISLVVGGIGIMNIMLATVSERTREIGVRRALGARRIDIIVQFLSETVTLTLAGGMLGILLGIIIPYFVTTFFHMPTVVTGQSLLLAFGISGCTGVAFGLYPAYRAAHMDPIESLRHE